MRDSSLEMLPPEREVDCDCETPLARPVGFDPTGRNFRVTACLRCGVVTVVEAIVTEPHPHDVRCVGNVPLEMNPALLAWLAEWPRVGGSYKDWQAPFFLAAPLRAPDESALEAVERTERTAQAELSLKQRLERAGVPATAAPALLIRHLQCFMEVWQGLKLDSSTPYEELLPHIQTWARPFARALLERRPTFASDIADLLCSPDTTRRTIGANLVVTLQELTPEILDAFTRWLDETPLDAHDVHNLLTAVLTLGRKASVLRDPLDRLAARVGDSDYYLRKRVLQVRERVGKK